ncbi:hypothetical protein CTA1_10676 [Colletotrichum tanaceti]|uniref:Uncharacterized protein n=1 Tax=Colletotrichum tanaceti TaxID=1306861 RepID=A0A4U6XJ71_9PEZI|nr:hypothetical protein CTA1_10676 [Colletotrichum tanaceti]
MPLGHEIAGVVADELITPPILEKFSFGKLLNELKRLERGDSIERLYTDPPKSEEVKFKRPAEI